MKAEIEIDAIGRGSIRLDDQDVSLATAGFVLTGRVGEVTRLGLDLVLFKDSRFSGEADVIVPAATVDALKAMGWTPPDE